MGRGRKPKGYDDIRDWETIFWENLPSYVSIIRLEFKKNDVKLLEVKECIEKLPFTIPKGLHSKEIMPIGLFPVISQSKEYTVGFSNRKDLVVKTGLPLVLFGDHSKTIKYVNHPFIIGSDGVKLLKPKSFLNVKYFYYFLFGVITETKDYGRHYKLLKEGSIPVIESKKEQDSIVNFLNDLKNNSLEEKKYFNKEIELKVVTRHQAQVEGSFLAIELNQQLELVKQLRQAFLQEAMQGKLVNQNPRDESASLLLEKIKVEKEMLVTEKKIKKQKNLPPITKDEIPFLIPKNWEWCRLGDICNTNGRIGWKGLSAAEYQKAGPLFLSVHSLNYGDYVDYSQAFHITQERYDESPEIMLKNSDILICKDGAGIGKLGIIKNLNHQTTINSSLLLIRRYLNLNTKFIYYFLLSSHFQKIVHERIMGATTPHLYQRDVVGFLLALPPLKEQERIVLKLDKLMQFCDRLESKIKESKNQNEMLLKKVLTEALGIEVQNAESQKKAAKTKQNTSKFDPNTRLMDIVELLKKHGKLHAEELWKMSKYPDDIDAFYAELKKQIELNKKVKESAEKGYLELV
jgi:type I restriction enzyme S subunit